MAICKIVNPYKLDKYNKLDLTSTFICILSIMLATNISYNKH